MKHHRLRLRGQMLVVYLLGGLLPMLVIVCVLWSGQRQSSLTLAQQTAETEMMMVKNTLSGECRILSDVSKRLYFDEQLEAIADTQYQSYTQVVETYRSYKKLDDLEDYYSGDINGITVYLDNSTLTGNSQLACADENIKSQDWYTTALADKGRARWWYMESPANGKQYLTLVRELRTQAGRGIGVATLRLNPETLQAQFSERSSATYLLLDGTLVLGSTAQTAPELSALARQYAGQSGTYREILGGEAVQLTVETLSDTAYCNDLMLVSAEPYRTILASVDYGMRRTLIAVVLGVAAAVSIILVYSLYFSKRVERFRAEMARAAKGERDLAPDIGGGDEISDLYGYLNGMIEDIDTLTANVYETQLERERANSRQREAEFKMLASQINPHFLFNTLESIRMKARAAGDTDTADMVKLLAKLMRYSIEVSDRPVPLRNVLTVTECYLKLQHYRFGNVVEYQIDTIPEADRLCLVPLLVQPLVENAFVHGLKQRRAGGRITVRAALGQTADGKPELTVTVADNGVGMSADALALLRESLDNENYDRAHIGVANVYQRIRLYYGAPWGLTIQSALGQGTEMTVHLPPCGEDTNPFLPQMPEKEKTL